VIYTVEEGGRELLFSLDAGRVDMDIGRQWKMFGADFKTEGCAGSGV
jgi:hypothetical protein